ncbi:MAG TPA: hypothetical protein VFQ35_19735 [Polyangiaceae bacterium]|nr:hypothetical protein [Polyangiaceae bacterium]
MLRRSDWVIALGALFGIGCSGPVETAVGAGLQLNVSTTGSCGVANPQPPDDLGGPPPDHTKANPGKVVFNGEKGVLASCSVKGSGPWQITGSVTSTDSPRVGFILHSGTINADGTGTADITLSTAAIGASVSSQAGQPCQIEAVKIKDQLMVQPNAVWATFNCPNMFAPPSQTCFVAGEFLFDHCP